MLRDVGVGAGQEHAEVGVLAARGPHLLAVDDPLVAVLDGPGLQAGQVRARLGLAEELAPGLLPGDDVPHVEVDLLLGAVGGDGGGGQQQAQPGGRAERAEVGDLLLHEDDVGAGHALAVGVLGQPGGGPAGQAQALPPLAHGQVGVPVAVQPGPQLAQQLVGPRRLGRGVGHAPKLPGAPQNGKLPGNMGSVTRMQDDRLDAAFDAWVQAQTAALDVVRQATGVPESRRRPGRGLPLGDPPDPADPRLDRGEVRPAAPPALRPPGRVQEAPGRQPRRALHVLRPRRLAHRTGSSGYRGECAYLGMTFGTPFGQGPVGGRTGTQTQTHIDEFELGPERRGRHPDRAGVGHARPEAAQLGRPRAGDGAAGHPGDLLREAPGPLRPPARGAGARTGRGGAAPDPLDARSWRPSSSSPPCSSPSSAGRRMQMWRDAASNMNTFGGQAGSAHVAAQEDEVRSHSNAEMTYHGGRFRARAGPGAGGHGARARQAVPLLGADADLAVDGELRLPLRHDGAEQQDGHPLGGRVLAHGDRAVRSRESRTGSTPGDGWRATCSCAGSWPTARRTRRPRWST